MEPIFTFFLWLHIIGGTIGLLTGLINILRKKGDRKHRTIGLVFFISMLTTGISAIVLALIHPNHFLLMIGIFTLYMVCSGQLYLKRAMNNSRPQLKWILTILMLASGILFIGIGVSTLIRSNLFGLAYMTFGGLGLLFVLQDIKNHQGKSGIRNFWMPAHLQRMTGAFIAALTAFIVVNQKYFPVQIPPIAFWLLPTIILTPLIIKWSRLYGAGFSKRSSK